MKAFFNKDLLILTIIGISINQFPNSIKYMPNIQYKSHTNLNTPIGWTNYIEPAIKDIINK